jgi:DNA (cytosine-5)-methyltransferase 1
LNVFDNASDTRATVLILFEPKSLFEENWAEAKVKNALRANASKSSHLIIDGTRVNDVRVYEDGIVPTVVARYGTGGGNVPMIFDNSESKETIAFDTQFGSNANTFENVSPTLKASQQPPSFLESSIYPIQNTVIGRADENGPGGKGYKDDGEPMFTVDTTSPHAIAYEQNAEVIGPLTASGMSRARGTETVESHHYVQKEQTVRRLTPIECERLQGFPDDWTAGQADSNRYKQMGNAVAVPVVEWIIGRLVAQLDE